MLEGFYLPSMDKR